MKKEWKLESQYRSRIQAQWRKKGIKGATVHRYRQLFKDQDGVCAICGNPPKTRRLSLDHNHETGQIRGLLCNSCNFFLGVIESWLKTPGKLESALTYLDRESPVFSEDSDVDLPRPYVAERGKAMVMRVGELMEIEDLPFPKALEQVAKEEECCINTVRRFVNLSYT
jgi:hypothetical protein